MKNGKEFRAKWAFYLNEIAPVEDRDCPASEQPDHATQELTLRQLT
jgi:hypothetical protein